MLEIEVLVVFIATCNTTLCRSVFLDVSCVPTAVTCYHTKLFVKIISVSYF